MVASKVRLDPAGSRFDLEAALGDVRRAGGFINPDVKFGFNAATGTSFEAVHSLGGGINFLQSAQTVRIKAGGNAADTAAGAGAQSIRITGIDDNLNLVEETIVTAGASASTATTALFWRVFRAMVVDVGTYGGTNTGAIVIEHTTAPSDLVEIPALFGQSQTSLISTAQKRPLVITEITVSVEATKIVDFRLRVRERFNDVSTPFAPIQTKLAPLKLPEGTWPLPLETPICVPALSDVWVEAADSVASAETGVLISHYVMPTL